MPNGIVHVTEYTDPTCPFAFSASPELLALRWHYGDQLSWTRKLVVLAESADENAAKGLTPEHAAESNAVLGERYGMPLGTTAPARLVVPKPIDLAIKAAQLAQPEFADRYYRALQVAWHTDRRLIDQPEQLLEVAGEVGLDPAKLAEQISDPATAAALERDKADARNPLPAATGPLDHKLAGPAGERRYTCPSLEIAAVDRPDELLSAPGIQNQLAYELLLANAEPTLVRRAPAEGVEEALDFADWPLATVEVAALMDTSIEQARAGLLASGASETDGYWSLDSGDQDQLATGAPRADRLVSGAGVG